MTSISPSIIRAAALCLLLAPALSLAQTQPAPTTPPTPAKTPDPTLDELLGLPKSTPIPTPTPAPSPDKPDSKPDNPTDLDPSKSELDRMLSPQEATEQFEQAVQLMDVAAKRVQTAKDVGLQTQRIQDDVLRKLDKLIADAQKKQSNSKSQSKQQQQQQQQQQQNQQQQAKQQSDQRQAGNEANRTNQTPGRQDGPGKAPPAGSAASWGNLPVHLREALQQGLTDQYSSVYRAKTEAYYKRLAEEPKSPSGADK